MKRKSKKAQVFITFDITSDLKKDGSFDEEAMRERVYESLDAMIADGILGFSFIPADQKIPDQWKH